MTDGPLTGLVTTPPWDPTEEQRELARSVRAVLTKHAPPPPAVSDAPGGFDAALWKRLCDIGLPALMVPEELGGLGGSYLDAHIVLTEIGREVAALPYGATLFATQAVLLADASPEVARELLAPIVGGERIATLTAGFVAERADDVGGPDRAWTLTGGAELVLDGARADVVLLIAEDGRGTALFEVASDDLERAVHTTMDRSLHIATVQAHDAPARWIGTLDRAAEARLLALAGVALTAAQTGGARRCLELTVAHVQERVQFGRPIGSFQAVKHRLADLLVQVETAEALSWAAAAAWDGDEEDAALLADMAASCCSEVYSAVAAETIQLHGGIAITWEHPAHRYFKHAHSTSTMVGTPASHRARLARKLVRRALS